MPTPSPGPGSAHVVAASTARRKKKKLEQAPDPKRPGPEPSLPKPLKPIPVALKEYEVLVIFDPAVDERSVPRAIEELSQVVWREGGEVQPADVWGRRHLAYQIKGRAEGIYAVVSVWATPSAAAEMDRRLGLSETVLRSKFVRPMKR